jgi:hypothetical protein
MMAEVIGKVADTAKLRVTRAQRLLVAAVAMTAIARDGDSKYKRLPSNREPFFFSG